MLTRGNCAINSVANCNYNINLYSDVYIATNKIQAMQPQMRKANTVVKCNKKAELSQS